MTVHRNNSEAEFLVHLDEMQAEAAGMTPAFMQLAKARQAFLREFGAWLDTNPSPSDVEAEVEGTHACMTSLAEMHGFASGGARHERP